MNTYFFKRKRLIWMVVFLFLVSVSFSMTANAQDKPKLRVWLFKSFVTQGNDVLQHQIETWAANNNVDIEFDFAGFADRGPKYVAAVQSGDTPDIGEVDYNTPLRFSSQLLDVTDIATQIATANGGLLPNIEPIVKLDGKFYAVPRYALTSVMFVRKDLMDAKHLTLPTTWDDFKTFVQAMNDQSNGVYGLGQTLNRSQDGEQFLNTILWAYGGGVFGKDGKPNLTADANVKAITYASDMVSSWGVQPPDVMSWKDSSNNEAFLAGKLAVTFNGASIYYTEVTAQTKLGDGSVLKDKTVLAPWPAGPAGRFTTSTPYSWAIFKNTKYADLCKKLILYLEDNTQFDEYLKVTVGQAGPVYNKRFENPYWKTDPNFAAILTSIKDGQVLGYPGPASIAASEINGRQLLSDIAGTIVVNKTPVLDALKDGQAKVQDVVNNLQK